MARCSVHSSQSGRCRSKRSRSSSSNASSAYAARRSCGSLLIWASSYSPLAPIRFELEIVREEILGSQGVPEAEREARGAERRGEAPDRAAGEREAEAGRQQRHRDRGERSEDAERPDRERRPVDRADEEDADARTA